MRQLMTTIALAALAASTAAPMAAQAADGPYKVLQTVKAGGDGSWDYVYADPVGRKLYAPRLGQTGHVMVFNLDTLAPVGDIPNVNGHGVAVDPKSGHAFLSSKPVAMWDAKTLAPIKTIDVQGSPDGILGDPSSGRIYVLSHSLPNITVIDAKDGAVVGTVDVGGAPEQTVSDGKGRLFVDVEDKDQIAVVDAKSLMVTGRYDMAGKCGSPAGLAIDVQSKVLFAACRRPAVMAMLNADTGQILDVLPIGMGVDGAGFNPATKEAFASTGDGILTVIKEQSQTKFVVEQSVQTHQGARTMTVDPKTGHVLLIVADFEQTPPAPAPAPAAAPPAGGPPAGGPPPGRRFQPRVMVPGSFSVIEVGK